jgi:deazaflavin-dependent oxidoreductase (nitroreductase family)
MIANPLVATLDRLGIRSSLVVELETIGAKSGQPRLVPLTGRADDTGVWVISQHGHRAGWAHNITANPKVRVKVNNQWRAAQPFSSLMTTCARGHAASVATARSANRRRR